MTEDGIVQKSSISQSKELLLQIPIAEFWFGWRFFGFAFGFCLVVCLVDWLVVLIGCGFYWFCLVFVFNRFINY